MNSDVDSVRSHKFTSTVRLHTASFITGGGQNKRSCVSAAQGHRRLFMWTKTTVKYTMMHCGSCKSLSWDVNCVCWIRLSVETRAWLKSLGCSVTHKIDVCDTFRAKWCWVYIWLCRVSEPTKRGVVHLSGAFWCHTIAAVCYNLTIRKFNIVSEIQMFCYFYLEKNQLHK